MKAKSSGPAGIVRSLVGRLDDGDMVSPERLGIHTSRTSDSGWTFAKAGTQSFRIPQPVVAKTRRASQEAISARILTAVNRLLHHSWMIVNLYFLAASLSNCCTVFSIDASGTPSCL